MKIDNYKGTVISGKYLINYNTDENRLYIRSNSEYISDFWGKNVQNCFAIVGDNGAGKTKLMNSLMETIQSIKCGMFQNDFILIIEENVERNLYVYCTENFQQMRVVAENNIHYEIVMKRDDIVPVFNQLEVCYFHNALNYVDCFCDTRCRYDFSLGKMIDTFRKDTYEMHYDGLEKDVIKNYYDNIAFRIIDFLYKYAIIAPYVRANCKRHFHSIGKMSFIF